MRKTIIQGIIGVVTPVQAVVASNSFDWRQGIKDANLIFGFIVGFVSVCLVVRRGVSHTLRDWRQARLARKQARAIEQDADDSSCDVPPPGWACSRRRGHTGPCAAYRQPADESAWNEHFYSPNDYR